MPMWDPEYIHIPRSLQPFVPLPMTRIFNEAKTELSRAVEKLYDLRLQYSGRYKALFPNDHASINSVMQWREDYPGVPTFAPTAPLPSYAITLRPDRQAYETFADNLERQRENYLQVVYRDFTDLRDELVRLAIVLDEEHRKEWKDSIGRMLDDMSEKIEDKVEQFVIPSYDTIMEEVHLKLVHCVEGAEDFSLRDFMAKGYQRLDFLSMY